ncbi:hypothetical protein GQX74_009612, partial [Glossina fuscipes]
HFQPNPEASLQQQQHLLNNGALTVPIPLVSKPAMYENSANKGKKSAAIEKQTAKKLKTKLKTGIIRIDESEIDASNTCSSQLRESFLVDQFNHPKKESHKHLSPHRQPPYGTHS